MYLDPFLDMFNGEILSYSITKTSSALGIMTALNQAITVTDDCKYRRTFHSDRGWAYQMKAYSKAIKNNRIFQSMSHKGNCLDNSVMENFFAILKQEIALLTKGEPLPQEEQGSEPINVIYQTAEDGLGDTIKPRLLSMGADCERVLVIDENEIGLTLSYKRLEQVINQSNAKVIVLEKEQQSQYWRHSLPNN